MSENNQKIINDLKLNLSEIIRKKHISCNIHSHNCSICEYGNNKECELNLLRDNTIENIKKLS